MLIRIKENERYFVQCDEKIGFVSEHAIKPTQATAQIKLAKLNDDFMEPPIIHKGSTVFVRSIADDVAQVLAETYEKLAVPVVLIQ